MASEWVTREKVAAWLREHGINPTYQRIEIAYALFLRKEHLCADELLHYAESECGEISKATVYNTLKLFVRRKLIGEVCLAGRHFFDPNTSDHHHFYNVVTGRLIDVSASDLTIARLPPVPAGTVMEGVEVFIHIRPLQSIERYITG